MVREREQSMISSKPFQTLKFVLPAGEALSQPPLSASLGQAQINSSDFCKQFNSLSLEQYYQGVLINVIVTKRSDNSLDIKIGDIFLPFIFFQAISIIRRKRRRRIYLEVLYDIFKLYLTFDKIKKVFQNEKNAAKTLFGSIRSARFKIKLLNYEFIKIK